MEIINRELVLDREGYYRKHLELVCCLAPLDLSAGEIRVLAAFMELASDGFGEPFGTGGRKLVSRRLGIGGNGVGNHLSALLDKGALERGDGGGLSVRDWLVPADGAQGYRVKLRVG